jgi:hypothetical protein
MTGPVREDFQTDPDEPLPGPDREPDLWDQEEGVPSDVEDIAIVCHEALRAYRTTQGSGSGRPWLNQTQEERNNLVELVHRHMTTEPRNEKLIGPPEALLVAHIVKALTP